MESSESESVAVPSAITDLISPISPIEVNKDTMSPTSFPLSFGTSKSYVADVGRLTGGGEGLLRF